MGATPAGGDWGLWGNGTIVSGVGTTDADFEYAVVVDGDRITYEIGAKAFIWYGGRSNVPTEVRQLAVGDQVGFDIVADTRYGSSPHDDDQFGMRSENLEVNKYYDAGRFQRYELGE